MGLLEGVAHSEPVAGLQMVVFVVLGRDAECEGGKGDKLAELHDATVTVTRLVEIEGQEL